MTDNLEKQRMATLLKSPELYSECKWLNDSSWFNNGNKWIWRKYQDHLAIHKSAPSINILLDYANSDQTGDNVTIESAKVLLSEYQLQSPQDHIYFKDVLLKHAKKEQLKEVISAAVEHLDINKLKEDIDQVSKQSVEVPKPLDLDKLMSKDKTDNQNLFNDWALERQAMLAIVAPTGFGKSVITMQLGSHFACGKSTLGFEPHRPYKVLVIQNEDSDNDIARMRDGSFSLLNDQEKAIALSNLYFFRLRGYSGDTFINALDTYCQQYKPDIIFVNPLLRYFDGDPINTKDVSKFLNKIDLILEKYNCGLIMVHHTTKQNKQTRINPVDSAYAGFGSAQWGNSVRDTIVLNSCPKLEGYWKLTTSKRADKWGWKDKYIQRNTSQLPFWREASDIDINKLVKAEKSSDVTSENKEAIFNLIQPLPITMTIAEIVEQSGLGEKTSRNYIKALLGENKIAEQITNRVKAYYRTQADNN
jgi:hypothetical protein